MNTENVLTTVRHYISVGRHNQAIKELNHALSSAPEDPELHFLLALCYYEKDKYKRALHHIFQTLQKAPDNALVHQTYGAILIALNQHKQAQMAIDQAMRLNPQDADNYAVQAQLYIERQYWDDALAAADDGLAIDPENTDCLNFRSMALTKLRRHKDASATIATTLHQAPENPNAHANMGWQKLHQNQPREALTHFQEALRLQPDNDYAKSGLVEALKARNPIYRVLLAYMLWMITLSPGVRFGVLIGGYVLYRIALGLVGGNPQLGVILWPLIAVYVLFALLTWVGVPAFNLLLLIHPYGRYALDFKQRITACVFGAMLVTTVTATALGWFGNLPIVLSFGIMTAMLTIIVTHSLQLLGTRKFTSRAVVSGVLIALMLTVIGAELTGQQALASSMYILFLISFVGAMWFCALSSTQRG